MHSDTPDTPRRPYVPGGRDATPVGGDYAGQPDDPSRARLDAAVREALDSAGSDQQQPSLDQARSAGLYAAVAGRVAVLRNDGIRPERALLILKRETNGVVDDLTGAGTPPDGARVSDVVSRVIRWSVEAYHRGD
jgi:hypothetical protein